MIDLAQAGARPVQRSLATHRQRTIRILIVDNNSADVDLCLQELKRAQLPSVPMWCRRLLNSWTG